MDKIKVESSVPVQSRVSIITLAEMDMYWEKQGINIKTMSQLVSWSIDLARNVLQVNNMLPEIVGSVAHAHGHLEERSLYQQSTKKRAMKKIANAMSFENMRHEGVDPKYYDNDAHNITHNKHSVKPAPDVFVSGLVKKAQQTYKEIYETKVSAEEQGKAEMKKFNELYVADEKGAMILRKDKEHNKLLDDAVRNPPEATAVE